MSAPTGGFARRGLRGGALLLGANAVQLAVAVGSTMLLSRTLTPADFGLFAMAMVAVAVVTPVRDMGLAAALVQRDVVRADELTRLGRLNAALTLLLGLAIVAIGIGLGRFWGEPRVAALMPWLALGATLRGLANLPFGLLHRGMAWGALATSNLVAYALATAVACALAVGGAGVGALIVQQALWMGLQAVLLHALARRQRGRGAGIAPAPMPDPRAGPAPVRGYFAFGGTVSATRLLGESVAQLDRLVVGRVADVATLGLYQNALRWAHLPMMQLLTPLKSVAVSSFARLAGEPARLAGAVREVFGLAGSLLLPLFAGLALLADPIVPLLLGDQWLGAVPLFRLLALAMLFEGLDRMANWLHLADGRVGARLRWSLATLPLVAGAIVAGGAGVLGGDGGASGVAAALLGVRALLAVPSLAWAAHGSTLRAADVFGPLLRPLAATLLAVAATALLAASLAGAAQTLATSGRWPLELARLGVLGGAFWSVYALAWLGLPGGPARARRLLGLVRGGTAAPAGGGRGKGGRGGRGRGGRARDGRDR